MKYLENYWKKLCNTNDEDLPDVHGLGLGVSPDAHRLAFLGLFYVAVMEAKKIQARPLGRPEKDPLLSKDAIRAFALWRMRNGFPARLNGKISNREMIRLYRIVEESMDLPTEERLFPAGNLESSVSRGKGILNISDDWQSVVCEKIDADLPQTTGD
ncbi:MAG: hypothetical protein AAFY35_16570 [Pseudomonadota bacterium]